MFGHPKQVHFRMICVPHGQLTESSEEGTKRSLQWYSRDILTCGVSWELLTEICGIRVATQLLPCETAVL